MSYPKRAYHPRVPGVSFRVDNERTEQSALRSGWLMQEPTREDVAALARKAISAADIANIGIDGYLLSALKLVPQEGGWLQLRLKEGAQRITAPVMNTPSSPVANQPAVNTPPATETKPKPAPATENPAPATEAQDKPAPATDAQANPEPAPPADAASAAPEEESMFPLKEAFNTINVYVPAGYSPAREATVAVIGDSHSDAATEHGVKHPWWLTALPEAGQMIAPGRNGGSEAWAGYTLRKVIDGVQGETGGGDWAPLARALRTRPGTLVAMFGGNESLEAEKGGRTPEEFKADLAELNRKVKAAGAQLIFIFPPELLEIASLPEPKAKYPLLRQAARAAAEENGFIYMDALEAYPTTPAQWDMGDQIHFNLEGHVALGQALSGTIAYLLNHAPLTDKPFQADDKPAWNGATVEEIDAPEGFTGKRAHRLVSPASESANGYAFVQHQFSDVKKGDVIRFAVRAKIEEHDGGPGGLQMALVDTTTWGVIASLPFVRTTNVDWKGGMSWTAEKDYPGVRTAVGIQKNTGKVSAVVGDYYFEHIKMDNIG